MKCSLLSSGIVIISALILPSTVLAQWEPDVRLTNNNLEDKTSLNNAKCLVSNGGDVHVFWMGGAAGVWDVWQKRSTDSGMTWGSSDQVTTLGDAETNPSVCLSGSFIHLVWADNRYAPNWEVYYKRSTDGGISWGVEGRLTDTYENSLAPSISSSGSTVHVVWSEDNAAFYKRSTDAGITWGVGTLLSILPLTSGVPSIAVSESSLHVVWSEDNEIHYKTSADAGASWGNDIRLTNDIANSWSPSVSASGLDVGVVWYDLRDGNHEIYFKRSTDGGASWGDDTRLTIASDVSFNPFVSVSGSVVHVVWYDTRDANSEIYYKRNPTGGVTGIEDPGSGITNETSLRQNYPNPFNPSTTISYDLGSQAHIVLTVHNELGQEIRRLVDGMTPPGSHSVVWDGRNRDGSLASSGIYFVRARANEFSQTIKVVLIR